jgi:hypothetical protein
MVSRTIYVYLPDEKVDVWAPVKAEHIRDEIYRIADHPDDGAQFGKGSIVRCRLQPLSDGLYLVAYEEVTWQ